MRVLAVPNEDEFDSLPPAVRRKFFSNLERFRLERMRLVENDHGDGQNYRSGFSGVPAVHLHRRKSRTRSSVNTFYRKRSFQRQDYSPRRLRKPESVQVAYLATQADSQWFHSLPQKIQQTQFSREEQILFHQGRCDSVILDAADEALYRLEQRRRVKRSLETSPSETTSPRSSIVSLQASEDPVDSAIDMDDSFYDSFRWLDEDGHLDLSLDDYHSHVVDTVPAPKQPQHRTPSFRRTLSFTPIHIGRSPTSNTNGRIPTSSQSSNVPSPLATHTYRSTSRPVSSHPTPRHVSHGSTSSIDPSAQYYQDPEARLKLRVYLASPQKFDEAVEFGFPSLDDKENVRQKRSLAESRRRTDESARTFLEDDSASICENTPHGDQDRTMSKPAGLDRHPLPLQPLSASCAQASGRNREMTLKMTLTRPDLRTTDSPSVSPTSGDDPFRLAELPAPDENTKIWDSPSDERGMVKKMWRKFRRRS